MHPALRILLLVLLAMLVQRMPLASLLVLGVLVVGISLGCYRQLFIKTLRRSRWLLLTLLLIYALTTPGEYLREWPLDLAPTREGLEAGGLQSLRLVIMLGGLAILLGSTGRQALMAGIYVLLQPLACVGVSAQRFTARLWLTLDYVEQPRAPALHLRTLMSDLVAELPDVETTRIELNIPGFTWRDAVVTSFCFIVLIWIVR